MERRVSRSSADSSCSPEPPEESRGSSVSTELREEYEDLLRYAVVTPLVDNSIKMAVVGGVGGGDPYAATMVSGATMVSTGPQQAQEGMSRTSRGTRGPQPPPSPLNPEMKVVSANSNSVSSENDPNPPLTSSSLSSSRPSQHGSQPMPSAPSQSRAPPPYTAMTAHRDLPLGMSQKGVSMPPTQSNGGLRRDSSSRSRVPRPPSELSEPMRVLLSDQLPRMSEHSSPEVTMGGVREDTSSDDGFTSMKADFIDPEMKRLEGMLDTWCLDLRRNVLAEFEQSRLRLIESLLAQFRKEREKQAQEVKESQEELERFKELLVTYEQSIARKDHVVSNLTLAMQKLRENLGVQRSFQSWKLRLLDSKRENFTSALASLHYKRRLMMKVWTPWFRIIHSNWKGKVERVCQMKAEEVCRKLVEEYEGKLKACNQAMDVKNQEVAQLHAERDLYEENMKKAFMRGVCALNMEAMSMFKYGEDKAYDDASREDEDHMPPPPSDAGPSSSDHAHQQGAPPPPPMEESSTVMFRGVKASQCKPVPPKQVHLVTTGSGIPWTKVTPAVPVINPSMAASVQNSKVSFQHFMPIHKRVGPGPAGQELYRPPEVVVEGRGRNTGRLSGRGSKKVQLKPPTVHVRKHTRTLNND